MAFAFLDTSSIAQDSKNEMLSDEIYLVSNELAEPVEFKIKTKIAYLSGLVKRMVDEYGEVTDQFYKYKLKNVDKKTLELVVEYLEHYYSSSININSNNKDDWDENFINGLDYVSISALKQASKYMEISSLFDLADSKSQSMVTLLPWDKNKGFNVTPEQCQVSNLLRSLIDEMKASQNNNVNNNNNNNFVRQQRVGNSGIETDKKENIIGSLETISLTVDNGSNHNYDYDSNETKHNDANINDEKKIKLVPMMVIMCLR